MTIRKRIYRQKEQEMGGRRQEEADERKYRKEGGNGISYRK